MHVVSWILIKVHGRQRRVHFQHWIDYHDAHSRAVIASVLKSPYSLLCYRQQRLGLHQIIIFALLHSGSLWPNRCYTEVAKSNQKGVKSPTDCAGFMLSIVPFLHSDTTEKAGRIEGIRLLKEGQCQRCSSIEYAMDKRQTCQRLKYALRLRSCPY